MPEEVNVFEYLDDKSLDELKELSERLKYDKEYLDEYDIGNEHNSEDEMYKYIIDLIDKKEEEMLRRKNG